ncbi:MAG: hypothetical protein FWD72_04425 [Eggerthellaceae bacterium]|nr:hypothetical protein [Eggerthellaceae bacterium]
MLHEIGDDQVAHAAAEAMVDYFKSPDYGKGDSSEAGDRLISIKAKWVIRNDDLKFADTLLKAIATAAGIEFFTSAMTYTALVGFLTAVFTLFDNARKKGARITEEQCLVLIALRKSGKPVSLDDLAELLGQRSEEVGKVLLQLKALRAADGTIVSVVAQDGNGLWGLAGV